MNPDRTTRLALTAVRWIGSPISILVHTILFVLCFLVVLFRWMSLNEMLLGLTTIVSLEAIYLALFIQLTVNYQSRSIQQVEKDIDEMLEDVGEIQEDIDEIQEDVDELQEDVEDISEDVEEMSEDDAKEEMEEEEQRKTLADIQNDLRKLVSDISKLQGK